MLTPEQYQAYIDAVNKFDKYIREHPEAIDEAVRKYTKSLADVRDIINGK